MTGVVHIVGTVVDVGSRTRQCCAWCGVVLFDRPPHFPPNVLLLVGDGRCEVIDHKDGAQLPANTCVDLTVPGGSTRAELARVLGLIEKHDHDYEIRYVLVWRALSLALQCGYAAGVRLDVAEPEWPVVHIELPTGSVTWHMPQHPVAWDGHDTAEKYRRVREFVASVR